MVIFDEDSFFITMIKKYPSYFSNIIMYHIYLVYALNFTTSEEEHCFIMIKIIITIIIIIGVTFTWNLMKISHFIRRIYYRERYVK